MIRKLILLTIFSLLCANVYASSQKSYKFCDVPQEQLEYQEIKKGEKEDFNKFIKVFSCGDVNNFYYSRIIFPLPIVEHAVGDNGAESSERELTRKDLDIVYFYGNSEPIITIKEDEVSFYRYQESGGSGFTWFFKTIDGKWYLYKAYVNNY